MCLKFELCCHSLFYCGPLANQSADAYIIRMQQWEVRILEDSMGARLGSVKTPLPALCPTVIVSADRHVCLTVNPSLAVTVAWDGIMPLYSAP